MQVLSEILTIRGYEQGEHNPLFEVWKKNDKYDIYLHDQWFLDHNHDNNVYGPLYQHIIGDK